MTVGILLKNCAVAAAKPLTQTTTWGDFETHLQAWILAHNITELRVMAPNDRPFLQLVQNLQLADQITLCCVCELSQ